ncbi:hypothetical protein OPU71_16365 [Niveibacterium sp. 24ML]|uniref:hypothetical protein n=1 Tax=Niveibacterium sp. 24ML TaxID=2985512 RepID=UPI00226EF848|nr:hypothetical protein [Niveibacterium sp. 24ML]MCX9157701.1 hypothetical protein [Niveibacterium sp. 24ML]
MARTAEAAELGFSYRARKDGSVEILHHGRSAATLRKADARAFLAKAAAGDAAKMQQLMARITGNYRRGNEGCAAQHPRNLA